ncbi:putative cytochrome b561 [Galendromus occidentalis]|uniref:Cytochrome b561 n=1 Tax=Galendromus occidentalis TaxID=34638 RepID=A0AAJ6QQF7_9ACAR|nr:putative cytochrome b561 [Galendromus occidentalis]
MSSGDINPLALKIFYCAFALTQVTGVTFFGLLVKERSETLTRAPVYFWHPVLATLGLIILQGESFLIYRILRNVRKPVTKIVHSALHFAALACLLVSLFLIFKHRGRFEIPSGTHGRLGLLSAILFVIQYVIAFITFLAPGAAIHLRENCLTVFTEVSGVFSLVSTLLLYALCVGICVGFACFRRRALPQGDGSLSINQS